MDLYTASKHGNIKLSDDGSAVCAFCSVHGCVGTATPGHAPGMDTSYPCAIELKLK